MSAPFVTELRAPQDVMTIGRGDGSVLHLRVQSAELWDAVRIDAPGATPLSAVKESALAAFYPRGANTGEFVAKVRGFEILNESDSLDASGIRDGSTILLARRRRRAVK